VEGEVEFESRVLLENPEKGEDAAISRLILKNSYESFILIITEILGRSNYFGEEEILADSHRRQNARCLSLTCILMEIPLEKLHKLLFYNEFRDSLESSSLTKCYERSKKIENFLTYRGPQSLEAPSERKLQSIGF
jgi:CRP-like cAMP-binding protein